MNKCVLREMWREIRPGCGAFLAFFPITGALIGFAVWWENLAELYKSGITIGCAMTIGITICFCALGGFLDLYRKVQLRCKDDK